VLLYTFTKGDVSMKKFFSILLIFVLIFITYLPSAFAQSYQVLHEKINERIIAKGVILQNIARFTTIGWFSINVLKVDLSDPDIDLDALFDPRGIGHTTNLLNMSNNKENIVASINTDFFSVISNPKTITWPVGTAINDGKIISTHGYTEDKFGTFGITNDKIPFFLFWNTTATVTAPSGATAPIYLINKYYSDWINYSIILFDRHWGEKSVGNEGVYKDTTEIVVENSIVKEIRKDMPGVEIPENGYVLAAVRSKNSFLDIYFSVGETVQINISTSIDLNSVNTAVGGGTFLLKDGQRAPNTWKQSGRNPYTALGVDANNRYLYLVAVDGRQGFSIGMTQDELAEFMLELGCHNAIQFDGGGSTTMTARLPGDGFLSLINVPSDGRMRSISEGLGVISNAPKTELHELIIESLNPLIFVNTSRYFIVKGYDSNYNPVPINQEEVVFSVEGVTGYFYNNIFFPTSSGKGKIVATYRGVTEKYDIQVLEPAELKLTPSVFTAEPGKSFDISVLGMDKNGYYAPIDMNDLDWTFENDIAEINENKIKINKAESGIIKVSLGEISAYAGVIPEGIGGLESLKLPENTKFNDPLNTSASNDSESFKFMVFGKTTVPNTLIDKLILKQVINKANSVSDMIIFTGYNHNENLSGLKVPYTFTKGHSTMSVNDNLFIWLDTNNGGLRETDAAQWPWLKEQLSNNQSKHVFLFSSTPIDGEGGFKDYYEAELFKNIVSEQLVKQQGKTPFVFYNGNTNDMKIENGVRYLSVVGMKEIQYENILSKIWNMKYILVTVNGDKVTYEVKNLF